MIRHNLITLGLINKYNKSLKRWYNNNLSAQCCDKETVNMNKTWINILVALKYKTNKKIKISLCTKKVSLKQQKKVGFETNRFAFTKQHLFKVQENFYFSTISS